MSEQSTPALVDWDLAASTAARLAPAGPRLAPAEIAVAVEDIRAKAEASVDLVHRITGLEAARDLRDSQILVVDRAGWAKANTQGFSVMMDPALRALKERLAQGMSPAGARVSSAVAGAQMGSILAFLSSKVLGQYEPFSGYRTGGPGAGSAGRLLLVAPNIVEVERQLNVEPDDFRLWVCLHEQTHRVQFAAAPWLGDHMMAQIEQLSGSFVENAGSFLERATRAVVSLREGKSEEGASGSLMELLQSPEQKAIMSGLTGIMSLLEGHANVVMDAVDASVVPSVKTIRQRFSSRGKDRGVLEKFFRRLLGLDAKMRQYTDGARFVRAVVDEVGMEGFNQVWERAGNLPTEEEIHDPQAWLRRMGFPGAA
ncbi:MULTISPECIES: zinc-dependent metalloprotease [Arthrobacter]|uniref:Zinc-dependent metalloprotease n=2 Tax=Arthrobacter TaxID=1663 RepID=A0ABU9KIQ5_9MICC|nr:zinc-dependent metalloprotease [Arthrobacter sp. YJM1]MDP5226987.1 zinc-dependent metalloprotease [Arthrobacter sp. YJM1]